MERWNCAVIIPVNSSAKLKGDSFFKLEKYLLTNSGIDGTKAEQIMANWKLNIFALHSTEAKTPPCENPSTPSMGPFLEKCE